MFFIIFVQNMLLMLRRIIVIFLISCYTVGMLAQDTGSLSTAQIISLVEPSFVNVTFYDEADEVIGYSTGFFESNNTVVTSYKLFPLSAKATITDYTNNVYTVLARVNELPEYDLALIKVNHSKGKALIVSNETTTSGSTIYAVSTMSGAGFTFNISSGKLSNPEEIQNEVSLVSSQLNSWVGGSGGGLLNASGQLIGIMNTDLNNNNNGTLMALHTKYLTHLLKRNIKEQNEEVEEAKDNTTKINKKNNPISEQEKAKQELDSSNKIDINLSKNSGGPLNSLYSLAIPGLGNYKVRKRHPYWIISTVSLGAVGYGIYSKYKAADQYDSYKKATTQEKINDYYIKANRNHLIGSYAITVGGVIWLADITNVIIKGLKNNKKRY